MKKHIGVVSFVVFIILCLGAIAMQPKNDYPTDSYSAISATNNSVNKVTRKTSGAISMQKRALTSEEAQKLYGTGYHGTRPHSSAENTEIKAAQNKCSNCGYHTEYGANSICQRCRDQGIR